MRTTQLKFLILFICLWLSGCAALQPGVQPAMDKDLTWAERAQTLSRIQSWDLNGLIAIRSSKDNWSATLNWQQTRQNYTIFLFGPLGAGSLKLSGNPQGVTLEAANGKKFNARNAESLLAAQTGWRLPVSNLYYWVRGLPAPSSRALKQFDAYHHLMTLRQQGWTIRYAHYISIRQTDIPSKIFLENSDLSVKIIINQWVF